MVSQRKKNVAAFRVSLHRRSSARVCMWWDAAGMSPGAGERSICAQRNLAAMALRWSGS